MEFDTKIAIILREDLATWQKLNVTSFLTSGILGANPSLLGQEYRDAAGNFYSPLLIQPVIVLSCGEQKLQTIHRRGLEREIRFCLYIWGLSGNPLLIMVIGSPGTPPSLQLSLSSAIKVFWSAVDPNLILCPNLPSII